MENQLHTSTRKAKFHGEGGPLFGIMLVNLLLTAVTFGLYYPWAKAKLLQYYYQETEFEGDRFTFHGTGQEMFKGFIKAIVLFILIYAPLLVGTLTEDIKLIGIGAIVFYIGIFLIVPLAIHGSMRYRSSRSSWRGIHFGYRGKKADLMKLFVKGVLLTIITLGFYSPWFMVKLRKYVMSNFRMGDITFDFNGHGGDLFLLHLKGYFLTVLTAGIYSFWYMKDIYNFNIEHSSAMQGGNKLSFTSSITAGKYFEFAIVNALLTFFTFGIAIPWVIVRNFHFFMNNVQLVGNFNANAIKQTEKEYKDATADDMLDMLDLDF